MFHMLLMVPYFPQLVSAKKNMVRTGPHFLLLVGFNWDIASMFNVYLDRQSLNEHAVY